MDHSDRLQSPPLIMAPSGCLWEGIAHDNRSTGVFSGKRSEGMYFFEVNLMHGIYKLRYLYFHVVISEKWILVCY